ncbi:phage holin, LLH family [Apilactobacillus xinyiensis]|uniref:phage holin, LLH family n=1 Tax=Apilactobacillus xinyiensis TaxID=2841032 RepID=UPI00200E921C|nr:phage holin, LLH family [Apilactobacillus xinyiensis]MCL0330546.1 phage holin family protein [Apilactobacillus xinyiensis]
MSMYDIIQSILWAVLTALAGFVTHRVIPVVKNKLVYQQNEKVQQAETMALNFAKNIVIPLAINDKLGNLEKRKLAVRKLSDKLSEFGINLPEATISALVERAYQLYKANGGDIHKLEDKADNNVDNTQDDAVKDTQDTDSGFQQPPIYNPNK